jgi:hypothetical protein
LEPEIVLVEAAEVEAAERAVTAPEAEREGEGAGTGTEEEEEEDGPRVRTAPREDVRIERADAALRNEESRTEGWRVTLMAELAPPFTRELGPPLNRLKEEQDSESSTGGKAQYEQRERTQLA